MTKQDQYECAILIEIGELLRSNAHLAFQDAKKIVDRRVATRMAEHPTESQAWFKAWFSFTADSQRQLTHLQA